MKSLTQGGPVVKKELLKGLTPEQIEKVKACKGQEELLKLAKGEGIELTEEQLQAISGGCGTASEQEDRNPLTQPF